MDDLTRRFEDSRSHLRAVAFRMLGSATEADDAVQEAWLKLARADTSGVENLTGWLTTVVARVCLDMLRSRKSRREEQLARAPEQTIAGPDHDAELTDSVGQAVLVVLDTLAPAERLAFVLHDMFAVSFDEIAAILGKSSDATRQLASRARRRVQGATPADVDISGQRRVVEAFLAALRAGDVEGMVAVLDPDVVARAQAPDGTLREVRGARTWAKSATMFAQAAQGVHAMLIDGSPGLVFAPRGQVLRALRFTIAHEVVVEVEVITSPERIEQLDIAMLD